MNLRPEEISTLIKDQIKNYRTKIEPAETGTVILFGDGIAKAHGLRSCVSNELLEFDDGSIGIAQNLEEEVVSIAVLSDEPDIHEGTEVRRTGRIVSVPVGEALLGRVVHALGGPIDGKGPINCTETVSYTHLRAHETKANLRASSAAKVFPFRCKPASKLSTA